MITVPGALLAIAVSVTAVYGMTNIVVNGGIFASAREMLSRRVPFLGDMASCMMCAGFHVGTMASMLLYSPSSAVWMLQGDGMREGWGAVAVFADACFYSGAVWVIHTVQEWFERGNQQHPLPYEKKGEPEKAPRFPFTH
jgi:hypothetical protein